MWHTIVDLEVSNSSFIIAGEHASSFPENTRIRVTGINHGNYFVTATEEGVGYTIIYVTPNILHNHSGVEKLRKKKRHPDHL